MKTIAILGGGNGAHAAAADLALKGYKVNLYEDENFIKNIESVVNSKTIKVEGVINGTATLNKVSSNLKDTINGADIIFLAVPAIAHKVYAEKLSEAVEDGSTIVMLPGTLGSLIMWNALKKKGKINCVVAETHTLPYATRLKEPGSSVIMNLFNPLKLGVIPASKTEETVNKVKEFYPVVEATESVLAAGLNSLNPIIHVPGVIMNAGRIEFAKGEFWFYKEGVTKSVARAIDSVDKERISILKHFNYEYDVVAHGVGDSTTSDDVYEAITNNKSFAQIKGPADTKNRYFTEDIPFGLAPWALIGKLVGVPTPMMDAMINIGSVVIEKDCWTSGRTLDDLGLTGLTTNDINNLLING